MKKTTKAKEISVTRTQLPRLSDYIKQLKRIWENNWITNHGPLTLELENKLKKYLSCLYLYFVSNGTVALEIAVRSLELSGEIITTPFSYVATTSSIVWVGCKPRFVDINSKSLNIDAGLIEKAINKNTRAILATHVYGNPCEVEKISGIAKKHGLKVIYDAAHSFGVKYKGRDLVNFGDISTLSFHATKLFHTAEGGAVITQNRKIAEKIAFSRNFGHKGQENFWGLGINGKNSELHAAIGLTMIGGVKKHIKIRKKTSGIYDKLLTGTGLVTQQITRNTEYNYAYYPVIFRSEKQLLAARKALNNEKIYPRRYFYPALNKLNYVKYRKCPNAEDITKRILCLPLFPGLTVKEVYGICRIIKDIV